MSFEYAFVAFVIIALLLLVGALLCFVFNSKVNARNFFGYYFSYAGLGLLMAFITLSAIATTDNSNIRKTACRSELTPALIDSDLSTEEVKTLLKSVCK